MSTSGYIVCMAGGPVHWISKLQSILTFLDGSGVHVVLLYCTDGFMDSLAVA